MDAPLSNDDERGTLYDIYLDNDTVSPDEGLMDESLRKEVAASLNALHPRERQIIILFYGLQDTVPVITSYSIHYTKLYDKTKNKKTNKKKNKIISLYVI